MAIYNSQSGATYNLGSPASNEHSNRQSRIEMAHTNPLKPMDRDPFEMSMLHYPSDMANVAQNGHYMLFYVNVQNVTKYSYVSNKNEWVGNKYVQAAVPAVPQLGYEAIDEKIIEKPWTLGASDLAYRKNNIARGNAQNFNSDGTSNLFTNPRLPTSGLASTLRRVGSKYGTTRVQDSVALYLPPNVEDTYTANYNAHQTGMLGFLAASGLHGLAEARKGDMGRLAAIVGGATLGFLDYAAKKALLQAAEFIANAEGGEEMFNAAFARADNPYMEVLFDKVSMREFTYNFTFVPRNRKEQSDVKRIISLFRFHMAPELRDDHNRFITLPSTFDIHYMYQHKAGEANENDFYNKIATCVLSDCKVNYTPDGVRSHDDGSPVHITMSLTFKETEMITKDKINQGY